MISHETDRVKFSSEERPDGIDEGPYATLKVMKWPVTVASVIVVLALASHFLFHWPG